jgi:hypothetical protein
MRRTVTVVLSCAVLLAAAGVAGAQDEVPPSNDSIEAATAVAGLPFDEDGDNYAATVGPEDADSCVSDATRSVWYQYTPTVDETLEIDVDANFYPVIELFAGPELLSMGCANDYWYETSLRTDVTAGTTYFIRLASVFDWPGDYELHMESYVPLEVDVAISDRARLTSGGRAELAVTVSCNQPAYVELEIDGRQALGPLATLGDGWTEFACTGVHNVTVRVDPRAGAFVPGRIDSSWQVYACGQDEQWYSNECTYPEGAQESLLLPV